MTFRCLDNNKIVREVSWIYVKKAWVPVITVCTYQLYPRTNAPITGIPDVSDFNLSLVNLGLNVSWLLNSNYQTEITYNYDNSWEEKTIEIGENETMIDLNPGDTLQVRARFTDGNGNYSANYTTASITVWNMEDLTLYGLTENVNSSISEANTLYTINYGDEFYADKLKTFTVENTDEDNHKIFFFNGLIYRLVYRYRDSYQGYEFESIDPVTLEVTPINLISTNPNIFNCTVQAMCFHQGTQYAYVSTNCGFYRLELNGFVTELSTDGNGIKAMTFYNDQLLALQDNDTNGPISCYVIDPSNGARDETELFVITVPGYTTTSAYSLITHDGNLYAILNGNNGVDYAGIIFVSIEMNETNDVTFISQLTDPSRILGSVYLNEVPSLVIQQVYTDFSGLYHLSDEGVVGELIIDTKICCNIEEYQALAFNPVDRHIYHACMRVRDYDDQDEESDPTDNITFVFEKLNPDTLEVTEIETTGSANYVRGTSFQTTSYIDDGGNDMYDDGNFLGTNRSQSGFIEYTHTQQSDSDWENFQQIADGVIVDGQSDEDGYDYFGAGSKYFTNMYEGLFVMVAKDIDITSFAIYGELGADGNGLADRDTITLNNGHTGYFKKVYNANDPSVNQLIIIPSKSDAFQRISYSTHQDFHSVENLSGVDYIYYLLFSSEESEENEITSEQAQTIGNSFLNTITGQSMTIENILTRLNSGVTNITQNIPNMFTFTDWSDGINSEYIDYRPGLSEPHCMTYQAGNKFLISSDEGLYSITTDGRVSFINSAFHWTECRGLAFVGNRLFGCFASVDQIAEIDPYTGDILTQFNKKGWSVVVDAGENQLYTYAIRALAGSDDGLFIMSYDDNATYTIALISNLEPDESNILYATSLGVFRSSGGLAVEKFGKKPIPGNWFWGYNEEFTGIRVPMNYNEEQISFTADEIEVQWHEDDQADQSYTDWNDIEVQEVVTDYDENDLVVVIDKPANNFRIRMRYKNPVSKWNYYHWD